MLLDPGYDAWVRADPTGARFRDEALATHRRTNRVTAGGRAQLPWPSALGTQPWALARELATVSGTPHVVRLVPPWGRDAAYDDLLAAGASGQPVAAYVGNALLPRHVVLVTGDDAGGVEVYDPATGLPATVERPAWVAGRLGLSGWDVPWALVRPAAPSTPA